MQLNFTSAVVASGTNTPLVQSLTGSGNLRTNVLESFFILTRQNLTWTGVGYVVDTASTNYFNPLYRFSASPNVRPLPECSVTLYTNYLANIVLPVSPTNSSLSHLMDGVVDLRLRAYDPNGVWMTNGYGFEQPITSKKHRVLCRRHWARSVFI